MNKVTKEMLVKAKLILNKAKIINNPTDLEFLLEQYEFLVNLINDSNIMPHVATFDSYTDTFKVPYWGYPKINKNGYKKIDTIIMNCEEFIRLNSQNQKQMNKPIEESKMPNNSSKLRLFIDLIILFLGCSCFYECGKDNGEIIATQKCNDNMKARDSLSLVLKNYIGLQQKYDSLSISDSIMNFKEKNYNQELKDSLKEIMTSNQYLVEKADASKQIIDSLESKLKKEIAASDLLHEALKKTRDSLNSRR